MARRSLIVCAAILSCARVQAAPGEAALRPLPRKQLEAVAGAARRAELAVIESKPDGTMRQVTMIVFVRAPAEAVRALVADVGGYLRFVPNLKAADFKQEPDGRWVNTWRLELPIATFAGRDAYEIDPAPLGPIRFHSLGTLATYQWDFVPVAGGMLLVQCGYTDVLHANRFVRAFVRRQPALEHGLALAAQYMLVSAVKKEAERRSGMAVAPGLAASAASLERLTERGQVVVMRAEPSGKLAEVSVIDHIFAAEARVHAVLADVSAYHEFMAGVDRSTVAEHDATNAVYLFEMALPIVTWSTIYRMRIDAHAIDGAGISGDLRGARYRWDLSTRGAEDTLVTYRANQPLARGNILVKKLFEVDPSLEHGLNVAFAFLQVRSIRGRVEGWATK